MAFAFVSVVTIAPASKRCAARLASRRRWCAGSRPRRGPFVGVGTVLLLHPQREASLVELLQHFLERLRPEVGDRQKIIFGLLRELTNGVDPGPLQAVAGTFGEVKLLDRELEVGGRRRGRRHLSELETLRRVRQISDEADQAPQRVTRG